MPKRAIPSVLVAGLLLVTATTWASDAPIPKIGASCPSGFRTEGRYCVPYTHRLPSVNRSSQDYLPKLGASCPSGYRTDSSGYCIRYRQ